MWINRDEDWHDNDGALNTISMTHPRFPTEHPSRLVEDDSECQPFLPGIWFVIMFQHFCRQWNLLWTWTKTYSFPGITRLWKLITFFSSSTAKGQEFNSTLCTTEYSSDAGNMFSGELLPQFLIKQSSRWRWRWWNSWCFLEEQVIFISQLRCGPIIGLVGQFTLARVFIASMHVHV